MRLAAARTVLRIARRAAVRSKGRSALVVAMVGIPVLGLTGTDVLVRTAQLPRQEVARRQMGTADLVVHRVSNEAIVQDGISSYTSADADSPEKGELPAASEPPLPAGSRRTAGRSFAKERVATADGVVGVQADGIDLADPLVAGMFRFASGRAPRGTGEVAVTRTLAELAGVRVGDRLRLVRPDRERVVAGIVVDPGDLKARTVFTADARAEPQPRDGGWLVDLPPGTDQFAAMRPLNAAGWHVTPRAWVIDPPPEPYDSGVDERVVGGAVVAIGLAALEIVLLAGTAFAVGARRQRRDLALVAAAGGSREHVRGIVLASGLVLGAVGGLAGAAGGVALAALTRSWLERASGSLFGPFDVRPVEVAAVVLIGVVTGLVSAALPARSASRQDVVAALTGRRGQVRTPRSLTALALVAVAVGIAIAWKGAAAYDFNVVLAGAVVAELGFVGLAPALVGAVAKSGRRLPTSLRIAVRDAARHRARTGPAVAAVCAALAGSVAMSVYLASDTEEQRRRYRPTLAAGQVRVYSGDGPLDAATLGRIAAQLPTRRATLLTSLAAPCDATQCYSFRLLPAPGQECPLHSSDKPTSADVTRFRNDPRCVRPPGGEIFAGDAETVAVLTGRDSDPAAARTLRDGGAVVFDRRVLDGGRAVVAMDDVTAARKLGRVPLVASYGGETLDEIVAVVSPATAARLGAGGKGGSFSALVDTTRMPTEREEQRALAAAGSGSVYVERGFRAPHDAATLALLAGSLLITLLATGVAVGLAAADSRPDLATLAAIGAAPRTRRVLAGAQALTVSGIGAGLGVLAGLVPAIAVLEARRTWPIVVPWGVLVVALVGVPLLTALPAALLTRSRLPLERRIA